MFNTTMILHKSSCTSETTLCTGTNVGITVVRNVATIKTEPHQHTCINQKCVGGSDNYSNHVTRERHVFCDCDCLPCGLIECMIEQYYTSMQSMQIIYMYLLTGNATVKLKMATARSSWPTAEGPVGSSVEK